MKMEKSRGGGQGGCERRIEVIVKMQRKSGVRYVCVCVWGGWFQSVWGSGYL